MPQPDYLKPYQDALKEHGPTFEAMLWRNTDYQQKRFAVIADLLGDPLGVIADMGCGRADLLVHLVTIGVGFKRYIGVEGVTGMLEYCRERYGERRDCNWLAADFVADQEIFNTLAAESVDTFVFSGSLNTLVQDDALAVIRRAAAAGRVVFNVLSAELYAQVGAPDGPEPGDPANRFDKDAVLAACREMGEVEVREGYLPSFDVTIRIS